MMKRILILIIVVVLVGILIGVYLFLRKPASPLVPSFFDRADVAQSGEATGPGLVKLTTSPALEFWLDSGGGLYYTTEDGKIFLASGNDEELISSLSLGSVRSVSVSPNKEGVIFSFVNGGTRTFKIFNILSRSWRSLPANTLSAAWSLDGARVAYLSKGDKTDVNILDLGTGRSEKILSVDVSDMMISWPTDEALYLIDRPSSSFRGVLAKIDIPTKRMTIVAEEEGLIADWTLGNSGLAFSDENGLHELSLDGVALGAWPGVVSFPKKCAVTAGAIYCGGSGNLSNADFPDKYLQRAVYSADSLVLIPWGSGSFEAPYPVYKSEEGTALDIYSPLIYNDDIYFINRYDGLIYSISLTKNP